MLLSNLLLYFCEFLSPNSTQVTFKYLQSAWVSLLSKRNPNTILAQMPILKSLYPTSLPQPLSATHLSEQCTFLLYDCPSGLSHSCQHNSYVPLHAWQLIAYILSTRIISFASTSIVGAGQSPGERTVMGTIDLGHEANIAELEGIVLGLVFTATVRDESQDREAWAKKNKEEKSEMVSRCVHEAVGHAEENGRMAGVLVFEDWARVNFLVYRVDY